jgi:hypothetical protein
MRIKFNSGHGQKQKFSRELESIAAGNAAEESITSSIESSESELDLELSDSSDEDS